MPIEGNNEAAMLCLVLLLFKRSILHFLAELKHWNENKQRDVISYNQISAHIKMIDTYLIHFNFGN
jgi:hypothetical protein